MNASFLLCAIVIVVVVGASFIFSHFRGAVWVPAFSKDTDALLKQLNLERGTHVFEFGCGDGRFLRKAAAYGAEATGYEINPFIWKTARVLCWRKNITIKLGNAWNKPFGHADVVFAFIMPRFMEQLGAKLTKELKPGATIVTYTFPIPNMEHYLFKNNCYFYKIA
jgi:SAM-dependent methyltransferase